MLFNSYEFIFIFLPLTLISYFLLNKVRLTLASKVWLIFASLFFYSWWNIRYLPLILGSISVNFALGSLMSRISPQKVAKKHHHLTRKLVLIISILFNLGLLGFYKYTDFFIANANHLLNLRLNLIYIVLPLGISFFTFTQIAYLVDSYKGEVKDKSVFNYFLFVSYFPHLLAGPILHHKEMMPQFDRVRNKGTNYKNLYSGLFLFSVGLFKKVIIADYFMEFATAGFDHAKVLPFFQAWFTSLAYTLQIYYDFSGYTDMALGSSWMFNIRLPINFDSPYKSLNIQEFWRRWHITLSRFLRDYIYIPLGGNRFGEQKTYHNLMATFLLGGLWHGAGWTFVFWGFLHGAAMVIYRLWRKLNMDMPSVLAWFITFNFLNITWIFFRAKSWDDAVKVLKGMFGLSGITLPYFLASKFPFLSHFGFDFGRILKGIGGTSTSFLMLAIFLGIAFFCKNSNQLTASLRPNWTNSLFIVAISCYAILNMNKLSEFIYFQF